MRVDHCVIGFISSFRDQWEKTVGTIKIPDNGKREKTPCSVV